MKCGVKTPTKLSPSKLKPEESPTKNDHDPCGGHDISPKADTSVEHLSPSRVSIFWEDRPVNNKENLLRRLSAVETSDLECSPLQDSGYSSVLLIHSRYRFLRFEEAACSTLKKSGKRCPKVDWDTLQEVVSREAFYLDKLIGKKMGLERMDILGELFQRDFKHLLSQILRYLNEIDLINVISVSTTWRKILQKDNWAYSVYKRCHKEICEGEARREEHTATREASVFRIPLSSVQKVASAACCVSKKKSSKKSKPSQSHSRYSEYIEVGRTLTNDRSLKVCIDCGSPAKYDSYQHRAVCTRDSCQLDFCTLCNCKYHFSKDCATSKAQNHRYLSEPLPGSKKSKQNLRRL
ncbi:unnamed protein product [Ranitomeya imitator]|uniref:ZBR-type domain-containing protein n=1 Tax=Ranitomeya imitator TaxID=111125 RepID=A0ABN9MN01_9NEOB|nr:unnamed protein product [Ranitomeya imitator]